jgi:uncharacterized membrane protein
MDTQQSSNTPFGGNAPQGAPSSQGAPDKNVVMGVLAYLGPLVIVSYIVAKNDPFVKFHIKQGLVLLVIEAAIWILGMAMWQLWMILNIVNLGVVVLSVLGIVNTVQGKEQQLPLVGQFSRYFPI